MLANARAAGLAACKTLASIEAVEREDSRFDRSERSLYDVFAASLSNRKLRSTLRSHSRPLLVFVSLAREFRCLSAFPVRRGYSAARYRDRERELARISTFSRVHFTWPRLLAIPDTANAPLGIVVAVAVVVAAVAREAPLGRAQVGGVDAHEESNEELHPRNCFGWL